MSGYRYIHSWFSSWGLVKGYNQSRNLRILEEAMNNINAFRSDGFALDS